MLCTMFSTCKLARVSAAQLQELEVKKFLPFFEQNSHSQLFLNKILIETAQKGTAVLQNYKHCRIHINFKWLCWKQSLIICYSSHCGKEKEDCDLRAGISAKMFTYRKELLSVNLIVCCIFLAACWWKYVKSYLLHCLQVLFAKSKLTL